MPERASTAPEMIALARELRELRAELVSTLGAVRSCSGCAIGHPEPFGHWPGGHCCGGRTEDLFTDDDLAALKLSGTTPSQFRAPSSDFAGCAFRGPSGCSLDPGDRPNLCVRFICRTLEVELRERGDLREVRQLERRLEQVFERFSALRSAELEALPEEWRELGAV